MNYIKQLQAEIKAKDCQIKALERNFDSFIAHLHSPKFVGEENGERKDWISTGDVIRWLHETRSSAFVEGEQANVVESI